MKDDSLPATKGDIRKLRQEFDDLRRSFGVFGESLRADVMDIVRDALSIFRDGHGDHEKRILRLERKAGLAVPLRSRVAKSAIHERKTRS